MTNNLFESSLNTSSATTGWGRRELLVAASSVALTSLAGCCSTKPLPPAPIVTAQATGIDIHCHVFNARDIPITGFVTDVALEGVPVAPQLLRPLIVLLALMMDACAWNAQREVDAIGRGPLAEITVTPAFTKALVQQQAADAIAIFQKRAVGTRRFQRKRKNISSSPERASKARYK